MTKEPKSRTPVALVTGAARRIGACIAETLHDRGCGVVLHYHHSEGEARHLAEAFNRRRPESAWLAQADLSDPDSVSGLVKQIRGLGERLDILVNNASRFYPTPLGDVSLETWNDLVGSNVQGAFFLSQALLPELRKGGGSIINILDIHAERPMRKHTVYCMAKAALHMMTLSMARELGPDIRVNGVSPGAIMWPENEPGAKVKDSILDRTSLKRIGAPEDIAGAVAFLALDAGYVTGQVLAVDGGRSLNI